MNTKGKNTTEEIKSHFAFEQHWNELPGYAGYIPVLYNSRWRELKELFHKSENYGHEKPLPVDIKKDGNIIVVNLYGFKIPEAPMVASFGTDATVGRVALCKIVTTGEYVAIAW